MAEIIFNFCGFTDNDVKTVRNFYLQYEGNKFWKETYHKLEHMMELKEGQLNAAQRNWLVNLRYYIRSL